MGVLPEHHEGPYAQVPVPEEGPAGGSVHHLYGLPCQLEGGRLEPHPLSRAAKEEEPKVYVYDVAVLGEQNVAVVPVLDLEQVAHHRVGSHGLNEVCFGAGVAVAPRGSEVVQKEVAQRRVTWARREATKQKETFEA